LPCHTWPRPPPRNPTVLRALMTVVGFRCLPRVFLRNPTPAGSQRTGDAEPVHFRRSAGAVLVQCADVGAWFRRHKVLTLEPLQSAEPRTNPHVCGEDGRYPPMPGFLDAAPLRGSTRHRPAQPGPANQEARESPGPSWESR
jgi:hypothetical protein